MAEHALHPGVPDWAHQILMGQEELRSDISALHSALTNVNRKVTRLMSDQSTLAKLTAILQGVLPALQKSIDDNAAKDATIADLTSKLSADDAAVAAAQANQANPQEVADLQAAVDAINTLVVGPSTPDVTPVPVADVPAVASGDTPVTDSSGTPIPDTGSGSAPASDGTTPTV